LGEFSSGSSLENYKSISNVWANFFKVRYGLVLIKALWATFWAIFSPTHLVTLPESLTMQSLR
jgi:hypothetical protein